MTWWVRQWLHRNGQAGQQLTDAADAVFYALKALGHNVSREHGDRQILIGGNIVDEEQALRSAAIPDSTIVYNLEQAGSFHFSEYYVDMLRRCTAWDYNYINALELKRLYGVEAKVVPFGWVPELERVKRAEKPEHDIMFLGSLAAPHRRKIIEDLQNAGLRVFTSNVCYGERRDTEMGKAKVMLNIHFHTVKVMESLRLGYAMANRVPVLSQCDPDTKQDYALAEGAYCASYDRLVQAALELCRNPRLQQYYAEAGYTAFRSRPMTECLRGALDWQPPSRAGRQRPVGNPAAVDKLLEQDLPVRGVRRVKVNGVWVPVQR